MILSLASWSFFLFLLAARQTNRKMARRASPPRTDPAMIPALAPVLSDELSRDALSAEVVAEVMVVAGSAEVNVWVPTTTTAARKRVGQS